MPAKKRSLSHSERMIEKEIQKGTLTNCCFEVAYGTKREAMLHAKAIGPEIGVKQKNRGNWTLTKSVNGKEVTRRLSGQWL